MSQAFIIMQIGNSDLDHACEQAIVPALRDCGLEPKRVDKHNKGELLKSEIISFIENSDIIVADLTNERPNCYLEVGYAMGVDKFRNLVLTAREDHNQDSNNHLPGGPKIHFDLSGYDILFWHPDRLDEFRSELEKRVRRRQAILAPASIAPLSVWDNVWIESHRDKAMMGLQVVQKTAKPGFVEIAFALSGGKPNIAQTDLLEAAKAAQIDTFGWPIGVVLDRRDEYRPRPTADGIIAEIAAEDRKSYDYWSLRRNGDYYLLQNLFEDMRQSGYIYFNTRIVRITETLLYCARLYSRLGIPSTTIANIHIVHGGLAGRILGSAGGLRDLHFKYSTTENEVLSEIAVPLSSVESNLVQLVKNLTHPLFMVFDFFNPSDALYGDIVNKFIEGKVT